MFHSLADAEEALDRDARRYRKSAYVETTKYVYRCQLKKHVSFCESFGYTPVPCSDTILCRYIAYLARSLTPQSVKQYLNAVRIMHLECGFANPLEDRWVLKTLMKGVTREKGVHINRKLPITIEIMHRIYLNLQESRQLAFWAACLVSFYGMLRKSSLFPPVSVKGHMSVQNCAVHDWGLVIYSEYSKTIQCKERRVFISLPWHQNRVLCSARAVMKSLSSAGCIGPQHFNVFRTKPMTV